MGEGEESKVVAKGTKGWLGVGQDACKWKVMPHGNEYWISSWPNRDRSRCAALAFHPLSPRRNDSCTSRYASRLHFGATNVLPRGRKSECNSTYETPKLATFPWTSDDGRSVQEIGKRGRRRIVVFFTQNENRTRLPWDHQADFPNYAYREERQKNALISSISVRAIEFSKVNVLHIR